MGGALKFKIAICLGLSAGAQAVLAENAVNLPTTAIEATQALQGSVILSELLNGLDIPLNDPRFDGYAQVCLVGYDLIGEPLQRCKGAKESSLLAVPASNAPCVEFVGPEDLKSRELNVLMDGEAYCEDVGSNISLSIIAGWDGLTRDRIDFSIR